MGRGETVEIRDFTDLVAAGGDEPCELARDYPPYRSLFMSDDMRAMALYVRPFSGIGGEQINTEVESVVERYRPRFDDGRSGALLRAGSSYLSSELARMTTRWTRWVGVAMVLMFAVVWRATGLLRAGAAAVACGVVSLGATAVGTVPNVRNFGLLGMFGIGACAATTFGVTFPLLSGNG